MPQFYTLRISPADLNVLSEGLDELKLKIALPVAQRINVQINAQNEADRQKVAEGCLNGASAQKPLDDAHPAATN